MATVMVVDDTAIIRETVAKLLRIEGFQTVCVASGKEALAALEAGKPDLVLLDVLMPEMDGLTLLETMRANPDWKALPVILISAVSDEQYKDHAKQLGAVDYLVKAQCSITQMLDRVKQTLAEMT